MRRELHYFDIYPKVVKVSETATITIKCLENYFKPADGPIKVTVVPMTELIKVILTKPEATAYAKNGVISINYHFEKEQEYRFKIQIKDDEWAGLSVYALEEDLYELIPLKGETHAHTNISDGWESPEVLAGYYRKAGFDFIVISDHRKYAGAGIANFNTQLLIQSAGIPMNHGFSAMTNNMHTPNLWQAQSFSFSQNTLNTPNFSHMSSMFNVQTFPHVPNAWNTQHIAHTPNFTMGNMQRDAFSLFSNAPLSIMWGLRALNI